MKRKVSTSGGDPAARVCRVRRRHEASPPSGVTPTCSRAERTRVQGEVVPDVAGELQGQGEVPVDVVVRRHDYAIGSHTGWHSHPGPVFITVTQGELTYYQLRRSKLHAARRDAGHGFVDTGQGHMVRNESGAPAQDMSVIIAPVGGAFRGELDPPNPDCGF